MNKVQRMQLESWSRLRDTKELTFREFLKSQPKAWWLGLLLLLGIWLVSEVTGTSNIVLRAITIMGVTFPLLIYVRAKLYWPVLRKCIDWRAVETLLEETK